ncbi:hypothetical protein C8Q73DRAFT_432877 [Cubamyces lactineus]|nr:hypothetical protein C8Q73DRAFT_432877 [Cubamyces lactineus]
MPLSLIEAIEAFARAPKISRYRRRGLAPWAASLARWSTGHLIKRQLGRRMRPVHLHLSNGRVNACIDTKMGRMRPVLTCRLDLLDSPGTLYAAARPYLLHAPAAHFPKATAGIHCADKAAAPVRPHNQGQHPGVPPPADPHKPRHHGPDRPPTPQRPSLNNKCSTAAPLFVELHSSAKYVPTAGTP